MAAPAAAPAADPRASTADAKQVARWTLQAAREQIRRGNYDEATRLVGEVQAMNVDYSLFDDTPAKVTAEIEKARPAAATAAAPVGQSRDLKAARARLKEARALLSSNQFEQAEAIALDVKTWKVNFGVFEDTPDKVANAARALRRRDSLRNSATREQPSPTVYEVLVQEARQLMARGELDQAEEKARQASRMNVVPPLTSERAETVLHELAMARVRQQPPAQAPEAPAEAPAQLAAMPPAETPSTLAEREANELLARGDTAAASVKFTEAERLRLQESGQLPLAAPANDAAVHQVDNNEAPPPAPALPEPAAPPPPVETAPAPAVAVVPPAGAPEVNRGDQLLAEARSLYGNGNYAAARQLAGEAKSSGLGVDVQADDLLAQIALAEQGGALSLYESALDALRKGDHGRARALLTEVSASGAALDDGLMQKVQDLLAKLPTDDAAGNAVAADLPQPVADAEALAAQKLNAEVGTKIAEARRYQETDPDKAIAIYESTLDAVKARAPELPEAVSRTLIRRLEVALELAKKDKVAFDVKMKDKDLRAEIEQKRLRILEADKAKQERMKDLMDRATTAMAEGRYADAEKFAKMAQEIDPNEVAATILAWKANVQRHYKKDLENRSAKDEAALESFQLVDAAAVADPEVQLRGIAFAKDFKDLTRERLRMNAKLEIKRDPKTLAIEAKLNDPVSLNMENQPLAEAIAYLANYTGLNIVLDPRALADVDITTATPVNLVATNIRLRNALKLMLNPLGLNYKVEDEVLMITSPQNSMASAIVQTYYVGDLIMAPTRGPANPFNPLGGPDASNNNQLNGVTNPQAQQMALPNGASAIANSEPNYSVGDRPKIDFTPLIQLITATIAPGTWKVTDQGGGDNSAAYGLGGGFGAGDAGGLDQATPIGSITPFFLSISLIIRHTAEIHDQIADLLRQLRRLQDLQVSIEVRFITLSDSFFEQIGVDFDFDIRSRSVGKHSTFAIPNPANALFPSGGGLTTLGGNTGGGGLGGGGTLGGGGGGLGGGGLGGGGLGGGGLGGGGGGLGGGGLGGGGGGTLGGGLGGQNGGGLGGLGGGGGGLGGGTGGGTGGGSPSYIVNPLRDYAWGNKVLTVGTQGGGLNNFSQDLTIPFQQASASLIAPSNATPGAGATFGIAFLSDLEVFLFLTAAQGDTRTNILQAPKVTTFNGAPAFINNTETIYYVASLTPIVGPGSVAFLPQPTPFPNGVTLFVTPVVSADRRYVRMTLSPTFTVIEGFDTIQVPAAVGGSGLGGSSASINATLQLPRFNLTTVNTTVTVPDGGTVLLGGVKRLNEERKEFGVPVLSKTPMLNRLFRNIGIGRTTSSLMLMVTPRIIILEEEEERLGIPTVAQ
jgi:type II secretory pathway component GspD/PulD (secretin)